MNENWYPWQRLWSQTRFEIEAEVYSEMPYSVPNLIRKILIMQIWLLIIKQPVLLLKKCFFSFFLLTLAKFSNRMSLAFMKVELNFLVLSWGTHKKVAPASCIFIRVYKANTASTTGRTSSQKVTWQFCNHLLIIQSHFSWNFEENFSFLMD